MSSGCPQIARLSDLSGRSPLPQSSASSFRLTPSQEGVLRTPPHSSSERPHLAGVAPPPHSVWPVHFRVDLLCGVAPTPPPPPQSAASSAFPSPPFPAGLQKPLASPLLQNWLVKAGVAGLLSKLIKRCKAGCGWGSIPVPEPG